MKKRTKKRRRRSLIRDIELYASDMAKLAERLAVNVARETGYDPTPEQHVDLLLRSVLVIAQRLGVSPQDTLRIFAKTLAAESNVSVAVIPIGSVALREEPKEPTEVN